MDGTTNSLAYVGRLLDAKRDRKAKPTEADKAAAARIKAAYERESEKDGLTQEQLADRFRDVNDVEGVTQGAISQLLNGHQRISTFVVLFFAHALKMNPRDIRSDLPAFVLEQLRDDLPAGSRKPSSGDGRDFPFPFSRADWDAVADDVKELIVKHMSEAVRMTPTPASGGRWLPSDKS